MKINIYNIYYILVISFFSRIAAFIFFSDTVIDNEWGILLNNLIVSGVLGIHIVDGDVVKYAYAGINQKVLPSVFMPPLYAYFLYIIKILIGDLYNFVNTVIFIQIILSLFSILLFFKILKSFFSLKLSLLFSFIYSIIPINIYVPTQISSITIQIFLILVYLIFFNRCLNNKNSYDLVKFSLFGGLLILIRGEFFIFHILTFFYLILTRKVFLKEILIFVFFSSFIVSPYLIRNYLTFNEIVLTKSLGYNLLKGNNPESTIEGNAISVEKIFKEKNKFIKIENRYEINLDNFYKNLAFEYIKENPEDFLKKYFLKVFSFLFIDINSTYPNYYNLAHVFPKIFLSIFSLVSAILFLRKKSFFNYISLFYLSSAMFFSIFFILPRYNVMLIPLQLLLIANFFNFFLSKDLKKIF